MRKILFKAKRKDNGEWVEGFYFCMIHDDGSHVRHFIMPLGADLSLGTPIEKIQVEIDIETLCQYTGLTDRNGNKICENDVVSFCNDIYKIVWDEDDVRFALEDESVIESFNNIEGKWCEVIGNIFDNPELLEGGAE